jgi:GNAT superfamily N-acetyltransferase
VTHIPAELRIVRATRTELEDLIPLFDGYRRFYGQRPDPAAARAFLGARMDRDESVIYLAFTGPGVGAPDGVGAPHEPTGFTQLYPSFSSVSLKPLWILNDLYVRSDVRRGGVGRALLERARQHAVETGAKGLVLSTGVTNKAAQTLYESCGWRRDDEFLHYDLLV